MPTYVWVRERKLSGNFPKKYMRCSRHRHSRYGLPVAPYLPMTVRSKLSNSLMSQAIFQPYCRWPSRYILIPWFH